MIFFGASEASVDCFQSLETSQKFPCHCKERSNLGLLNFRIKLESEKKNFRWNLATMEMEILFFRWLSEVEITSKKIVMNSVPNREKISNFLLQKSATHFWIALCLSFYIFYKPNCSLKISGATPNAINATIIKIATIL